MQLLFHDWINFQCIQMIVFCLHISFVEETFNLTKNHFSFYFPFIHFKVLALCNSIFLSNQTQCKFFYIWRRQKGNLLGPSLWTKRHGFSEPKYLTATTPKCRKGIYDSLPFNKKNIIHFLVYFRTFFVLFSHSFICWMYRELLGF